MRNLLFPALLASLMMLGACKPKDPNAGNNVPPKDSIAAPTAAVPVFASPESALWDGEFLYISNVGTKLEPGTKDGDGYIMRLNADGTEWLDSAAFNAIALDAPKGMAVVGKTLYVADIDRLVAIDLKKVSTSWTLDFKRFGTSFLNDICVRDDSTLYVSATDINTIFQVDLIAQNFVPLKPKGLNGPNGLLYQSEGGKILCAEYGSDEAPGRLVQIDARNLKVTPLHPHTGGLDGLAMLRSGELVFTDWGTKSIHKLDLRSNTLSRIATDSIMGPADIGYNTATNRLCVPHMMENKISILDGEALK